MPTDDIQADGTDRGIGLSRRSMMRVVGGTSIGLGLGVGAFAGTVSATEVAGVTFCDCTRVTVRGGMLLGFDVEGSGDAGFDAVLYCGGDIVRRDLSGTESEQSYDVTTDPTVDSDCQIIAVEGATYSSTDGHTPFRFCNTCADCASAGLSAQPSDWCDDPADIPTGGGAGGVDLGTIQIVCETGCEDPGDFAGCTPGYWKNRGFRIGSWDATGYDPEQSVVSVFSSASLNTTLLEALGGGGGRGLVGAEKILLRAAVAALLNASHPDVDYSMSATSIISDVNAALDSDDRGTMLLLADQLDEYNNLGCTI